MEKVVKSDTRFEKLNDRYSPKIIGVLTRQYIMAVKFDGNKCPWQTHKNEVEFTF